VAYDVADGAGRSPIGGLVPGVRGDLDHQARLAQLLADARPRYAPCATAGAFQFLSELEALAKLPVLFGSRGPTHRTVTRLAAAP
jgi:adenylosuccinate synthase